MSATCNICCEPWSKKVVKATCTYCAFPTCQVCLQQYVLNDPNDPKCMQPDCKRIWSIDHLHQMLPKPFIKGKYKTHRELVLYDREVAMLPATQPFVEQVVQKRKINEQIQALDEKLSALQIERNQLRVTLYDIENAVNHPGRTSSAAKAIYVGRCAVDDCKGFVNAAGYSCGICDAKYCKHCFVIEDEDHECKKEDVDTFQTLRKDTKACPTCAALIHRTSGCSQMFCTQCNTAWDWNTYKVTENADNIHNPHYFEWRAANGAAAAAAAAAVQGQGPGCNQLTLRALDAHCMHMPTKDHQAILNIWRSLSHVNHVMIPHHTVAVVDPFRRNLDLRIKYLTNELDEKKLKSLTQIREKADNKKREIRQILEAFHSVGKDILADFVADNIRPRAIKTINGPMDNLIVMTKEALAKVAERYNCVVPDIDAVMMPVVQRRV